jgi:hypothetical protein
MRLVASLLRRLVLKNFVYDFNLESFHLAAGVPLLLGGMIFGAWKWIWYGTHHVAAPTGTVVLAALMITVATQLLISAVNLDLQSIPREPVNRGPLLPAEVPLEKRPGGVAEARLGDVETPLVQQPASVRRRE